MMKKLLLALLVVIAGGVLFGAMRKNHGSEAVNYRMVTVERGDIAAVVSATGTLDAVTTVEIGTQVSGIIDEICVDYNDVVSAGQVIARIDTTLLANAVAAAEAQHARSKAEWNQAKREYERFEMLHRQELVSDSDFNSMEYSLEVARADLKSAEADLARARQNLKYATIRSPIDGTIVSRSMEVGQTVQASFSAPELFLIAGDLTRMQILVAVDESDIGQITEGQTVRFTVQAHPDDTFTGEVHQVRLQSSIEENVVNYTVVVNVANPDGKLLPGMTATVEFEVETATDAFYVANASLRYQPDEDERIAAFERMRSEREAAQGDSTAGGPTPPGMGPGMAADDRAALWTIDEAGTLAMIPVRTGISDGTNTVVMGRRLEEGQQVIAGVSRGSAAGQTNSPFQQRQRSGGPPGPPTPGGF